MHIYIDADACPAIIKELLYKAVRKRKLDLTLVANQYMRVPESEYINFIKVDEGADVADQKIADMVEENDVVITQDIPLADIVVSKKAFAINPRGKLYTERNIKDSLSMRDLMTDLRSSGIETGGPAPFGDREKQEFANSFDRIVTKILNKEKKNQK